jgi:hypothetical protein
MFRLPEGWGAPEACGDVIEALGLTLHRAGVSAISPSGEEICGSAASLHPGVEKRAWYELAERVATLDAIARGIGDFPISPEPERWVYGRSNGVALHADWSRACTAAAAELIERDRVLRSWVGEVVPELVSADLPRAEGYEWVAARFPGDGLEVAGVVGFPCRSDLPLVLGFGARPNMADAIEAASGEAIQQLAFLFGEPLPTKAEGPPGGMLHLDTYQIQAHHPRLRGWLAGAHRAFWGGSSKPHPQPIRFLDLTPSWLPTDAFRVAKAVSEGTVPLVFGDAPIVRNLPPDLRLHPIP